MILYHKYNKKQLNKKNFLIYTIMNKYIQEFGLFEGSKSAYAWTDKEVKLLKKYASEKKKIEEISDLIGRDMGGIYDKALEMGIKLEKPYSPRNKWTEKEDKKLRDLVDKGLDIVQISTRMKTEPGHVRGRINKLGLRLKARKPMN